MPPVSVADRSHAGQAVYTRTTLAFYDLVVLGVSNPLIWRCPTRRILAHYDRHVTSAHLDVGVGTGWYLDRCRFPGTAPRIGLMDRNPHSLATASQRLARYHPEIYRLDVLRPLGTEPKPFQSIGLTYLLHCLPGTVAEKAVAIDNLLPWLAPGGVMFGATLLSGGVARSRAAHGLMRLYNRKGIFANEADDLQGLRKALEQRFAEVEISVIGCAALFVARGDKRCR